MVVCKEVRFFILSWPLQSFLVPLLPKNSACGGGNLIAQVWALKQPFILTGFVFFLYVCVAWQISFYQFGQGLRNCQFCHLWSSGFLLYWTFLLFWFWDGKVDKNLGAASSTKLDFNGYLNLESDEGTFFFAFYHCLRKRLSEKIVTFPALLFEEKASLGFTFTKNPSWQPF